MSILEIKEDFQLDCSLTQLNKEALIKKYTPLIKHIASRIILDKNRYFDYEDLVSYGYIGLLEAIKSFNPERGNKFSTYATIKIRGSIIDQLRASKIISRSSMKKVNLYYKTIEELNKELNKEPNNIEIAERMNCSIQDIYSIENNINILSMISLETLISENINENFKIENKNIIKSQEEIIEEEEMKKILSLAIKQLKEQEQLVLSLYYFEEMNLKEIGQVINVSESRVCQIHSRAILNIKKYFEKIKYKR